MSSATSWKSAPAPAHAGMTRSSLKRRGEALLSGLTVDDVREAIEASG